MDQPSMKNITTTHKSCPYRVHFNRGDKPFRKNCKTLEEAVKIRDEYDKAHPKAYPRASEEQVAASKAKHKEYNKQKIPCKKCGHEVRRKNMCYHDCESAKRWKDAQLEKSSLQILFELMEQSVQDSNHNDRYSEFSAWDDDIPGFRR